MGAGASTTKHEGVIKACTSLFATLKTDYEKLVSEEASPDVLAKFLNDAQVKIKQCAETAAVEKVEVKSTELANPSKAVHKPLQRGLSKGRMAKDGKKPNMRRRSYSNSQMAAMGSAPTVGAGMVESASTTALDSVQKAADDAINEAASQLAAMQAMNAEVATGQSADELADHWDSVRDLPFCTVCQMAFKTMSALDRHVKYSNLHETTVAKKKAASDAEAAAAAPKAKNLDLLARQEEGKDFRLLYYGSKFFWRTQDNVDISFYQHIMNHVIEVIPFDVYKNKEMERIYLDKFLIDSLLDEDIKAAVKKKQQDLHDAEAKKKFTVSIVFDYDTEYSEMQRVLTTTYVLSRLQLQVVHTDTTKHAVSKLMFHTINGDDVSKDPLLTHLPDVLIPVSVTHRRNTSSEEVKAKMDDLASDQAALRGSIAKAEKVSSMVHMFLMITKANEKYKNYSKAKKRFVMAVKRVMQINGVEKTKKYLDSLNGAKVSPLTKPSSRRSILQKRGKAEV